MPGMRVVLNCLSYCHEHSGIKLCIINYTQHTRPYGVSEITQYLDTSSKNVKKNYELNHTLQSMSFWSHW